MVNQAMFLSAASILSWMDKSVDPCEDFYRYSCGSWIKKSFIPEDKSTIGTFETLTNDVQLKLKGKYVFRNLVTDYQ